MERIYSNILLLLLYNETIKVSQDERECYKPQEAVASHFERGKKDIGNKRRKQWPCKINKYINTNTRTHTYIL